MLYIHIHSSLVNQALWSGCNTYNSQLEGHSAIKLFYLTKALDEAGSGYADIKINEAARIFDRSCSVIRRWIRFAERLGLFRNVIKLRKGYYRFYYCSVIKLCLRYGIKNLGAVTEIGVDELKDIKFKATEADAIRAQDKSLYAATVGKKDLIRKTLSAEKLCCKSKRILFLSDRFIYVNSSNLLYGASQEYIAKHSGYSTSTIQRRLDNNYRKARGLKPVIKKQQCIRLDKEDVRNEFHETRFLNSEGENCKPIFTNNKFKDLAFKPYTNIYYISEEHIQLRPQRYLRAKLNKEWAKILLKYNPLPREGLYK